VTGPTCSSNWATARRQRNPRCAGSADVFGRLLERRGAFYQSVIEFGHAESIKRAAMVRAPPFGSAVFGRARTIGNRTSDIRLVAREVVASMYDYPRSSRSGTGPAVTPCRLNLAAPDCLSAARGTRCRVLCRTRGRRIEHQPTRPVLAWKVGDVMVLGEDVGGRS